MLVLVDHEPATHVWHVTALVAATVVEYDPALQLTHAVDPDEEYVPAMQMAQTVVAVAPTTVDAFPAGHSRHTLGLAAPLVVEYVPALHNRHAVLNVAPDDAEYVPATQFVHEPYPTPDHVPAPHVPQVLAAVVANVPALH